MPKTRLLARPCGDGTWSSAEAREILRRQSASGLSVPAFARQERLHPQRLYWWRRKLSESAAEFMEVTEQMHGGGHVEVVLRSGRVLRVSSGIEPAVLRRLADALEQDDPC